MSESPQREKYFVGKSRFDKNPSAFDKNQYEQDLASLQQELADISEFLSISQKHNVNFRLCLDFDVIRSALDWTENRNSGSIWSSIVLNQTQSNVMMPPGTLSELIKFVSSRRRSTNRKAESPIGAEFVKLISGESNDVPTTLDESYRSSLKDFVSTALGDKMFFLLKKIRERFLPIPEVADVEVLRSHFVRSLRFLSDLPLRGTKNENNKIDALNFAVVKEFNAQQTNDRCILISETKVVHELGEAWKEEYFDEPRTYSNVWSSRKAAIYTLLLQKEGSLAGAERQSWSIIQEIVELRRNLRFPPDDKKNNKWSTEIAPKSDFLGALTSFEELFNYIKNDKSVVDTIYVGERTKYSLSNQKAFFVKFEEFLRDNLKLTQYHHALDLLNEKATVVKNMEIVDHGPSQSLGFLSKREFLVNGSLICTKADFQDRVLWVVESSAPLVEFIETVNSIRSELRALISTNKISIPNPEDEDYEVTVKSGYDFLTKKCRLGGRHLALAGSNTNPPNTEPGDIAEIRDLFEQDSPIEYKFFRLDSEFFSVSYEGRFKLINMDKRLSSLTNLFVRELARPEASRYDFEADTAKVEGVGNGNRSRRFRKS